MSKDINCQRKGRKKTKELKGLGPPTAWCATAYLGAKGGKKQRGNKGGGCVRLGGGISAQRAEGNKEETKEGGCVRLVGDLGAKGGRKQRENKGGGLRASFSSCCPVVVPLWCGVFCVLFAALCSGTKAEKGGIKSKSKGRGGARHERHTCTRSWKRTSRQRATSCAPIAICCL